MSVRELHWSPWAVVTAHGWGVLVQTERGARELRGHHLERPLSWLRSRLAGPTTEEDLLGELPEDTRGPMRLLIDGLASRGAITTVDGPAAPEPVRVELVVDDHPACRAMSRSLASRWQNRGVESRMRTRPSSHELPVVDGILRIAGTPAAENGCPSFRIILRGEELWLGLFPGEGADARSGRTELLNHLARSAVRATPALWDVADLTDHPWLSWLAAAVLDHAKCASPRQETCLRVTLGWLDRYEHRLVREAGPFPRGDDPVWFSREVAEPGGEGVTDLRVLSRRCATLVDDVTSPLALPAESGLRQLPLQLSRCRVRWADGTVHGVVGHGWTLEEARVRAVQHAVLAHGISRLQGRAHGRRVDMGLGTTVGFAGPAAIPQADVDRSVADGVAAAALGASPGEAVRSGACQVVAHLGMLSGRLSFRTARLPEHTRGVDLLRVHQPVDFCLMAEGLPFALAALEVEPGTVVISLADDETVATEAVVVQALLHHQSLTPGNETVAPRTYATPLRTAGETSTGRPASSAALLHPYGQLLAVPLSNGPSIDAVFPCTVLVLPIPGGD